METLDKTSTPDPATVSYRQLAMRYGGIWGGVCILVTLVGYLTNTDPSMPTTGSIKWLYSLIGLAVAIWAITTVIKTDRDQQLGGYIGLGRCIGIGTLTGLVAGVIGAVFSLLYMTVINPGFKEQMLKAMQEAWAAQGMSEEQIEMAANMSSAFTSPVAMALMQILFAALFGLIIGLVAGLFMKRERAIV